jgi:hypothetical protein
MHLFFCNDQQHGKSYLFPPGLLSSVPAIIFLNNHLFHVAYTLQCMNSKLLLWIFLTVLFKQTNKQTHTHTHTKRTFIYFFLNNLTKILYISEGFVIHSFWIKDLYLLHNRSSVMKTFKYLLIRHVHLVELLLPSN